MARVINTDYDAAVGSVGYVIETVFINESGTAINISTASTKQIRIRRPDGTLLTKTASFTGTGSDGKIQCTTIAGDLNVAGTYVAEGYAVWGGRDEPTAWQLQIKVGPVV